jgi:hypothetical protein
VILIPGSDCEMCYQNYCLWRGSASESESSDVSGSFSDVSGSGGEGDSEYETEEVDISELLIEIDINELLIEQMITIYSINNADVSFAGNFIYLTFVFYLVSCFTWYP